MRTARPHADRLGPRGQARSGRGGAALSLVAGSVWARVARSEAARVGIADLDPEVRAILKQVRPYTLTPALRVAAVCSSVDYIVAHHVEGAIVECGLWKGGSLMAVLLRLRQLGVTDREVVGFDTFAGMTEASDLDVDFRGKRPALRPRVLPPEPGTSEAMVRQRLRSTGYDAGRIRLVRGPVEETLPEHAPDAVALLRLDTDWYQSTLHELRHLYPRLVEGGVLIVDDYGHFQGARKAVDKYLQGHRIYLHRVDYSARLAVKQHG